jgi:GNAT superfamily N-acetyltransferase
VRRATVADLDELVRLRAMMLAALGAAEEATWPAAAREFLADGLVAGTLAAVVADDPGTPGRLVAGGVGLVLHRIPGPASPDGRIGHIASMATEPAWRGRGLATAVVEGLLAWFAEIGVRRVTLHASPMGEAIYRSRGFVEGPNPELERFAP